MHVEQAAVSRHSKLAGHVVQRLNDTPLCEDHALQLEFYEHELVDQAGHICKPAALANLDIFYAARHAIRNIPLRKNGCGRYVFEYRNRALIENPISQAVSIRQIAKSHRSLQGEVLCRQTLRDIGHDLGYASREVHPKDVGEFVQTVISALRQATPLLICYAMGTDRRPSLLYRDDPSNEHAGLIVGYHPAQHSVTLASSGRLYHDISVHLLWRASRALPAHRHAEHYLQPSGLSAYSSSQPKYAIPFFGWGNGGIPSARLSHLIQDGRIRIHKTPVSPSPDSGYRGVLLMFTPALEHPRWCAASIEHSGGSDGVRLTSK